VIDRSVSRGGIFIDQAEGGAADGFGDAELFAEDLDESGFSGTEVATEQKDALTLINTGGKGMGYVGDISQVFHEDFHAAK